MPWRQFERTNGLGIDCSRVSWTELAWYCNRAQLRAARWRVPCARSGTGEENRANGMARTRASQSMSPRVPSKNAGNVVHGIFLMCGGLGRVTREKATDASREVRSTVGAAATLLGTLGFALAHGCFCFDGVLATGSPVLRAVEHWIAVRRRAHVVSSAVVDSCATLLLPARPLVHAMR
ncbi:hypothetical protein BKA80DRAFT_63074 [Phyllosticta citrichinensis]